MRLRDPQFFLGRISSWAALEQVAMRLLGYSPALVGHLCQEVQDAGDKVPGKRAFS